MNIKPNLTPEQAFENGDQLKEEFTYTRQGEYMICQHGGNWEDGAWYADQKTKTWEWVDAC